MRIKLETEAGATYKITREDGMVFMAAVSRFPPQDPAGIPIESWSAWPKGHFESRMRFPNLNEALDQIIERWLQQTETP